MYQCERWEAEIYHKGHKVCLVPGSSAQRLILGYHSAAGGSGALLHARGLCWVLSKHQRKAEIPAKKHAVIIVCSFTYVAIYYLRKSHRDLYAYVIFLLISIPLTLEH